MPRQTAVAHMGTDEVFNQSTYAATGDQPFAYSGTSGVGSSNAVAMMMEATAIRLKGNVVEQFVIEFTKTFGAQFSLYRPRVVSYPLAISEKEEHHVDSETKQDGLNGKEARKEVV